LDGHSMTGKTKSACSLSPPPVNTSCLYVDCSTGLPDMRKFNPAVHRMVILDELSATSAIACKKMLQASNDIVNLGTSPTMQFSFALTCWKTMFVVASNTWQSDLAAMRQCDKAWLELNAVYIEVKEPLFV